MPTVHWLGAGLSSAPGIRRLAGGDTPLVLWNRTPARARATVAGLPNPPGIRELDFSALSAAVNPGDVLVSMLPADLHLKVARLALDSGAHFISSSYIAPDMQDLDSEGRTRGLCLVNEVGLDPGLDHLLAHRLLHAYRPLHQEGHRLRFRSWCGGFPALANDFRYKFSWSPVGVLRALRSPSRCVENGKEKIVQRPWQGLSRYEAALPGGHEQFEAYANRDSLPFINQYGFDAGWKLDQFVRGTLRLDGWAAAWRPLFEELDTLEGESGELRLQALGAELWEKYAYDEGEADRVVLCVELEALDGDTCAWHGGLCIDARGNDTGSAMGRLVSHTVSFAVDSVLAGELPSGVSAAPADPALIDKWLCALAELGDEVHTLPRS
ncbi:saccharopine dehydrogenase [Parahaliea maris]|uniref:Saccharopine dehydrogenase n=1 Tax=Parahaliea maris TaxID=2716870 RepID=A0A5C9A661_9GAMM|nr:saccharopine dehydrogenase family protein [Parahaliea maris]TXS95539.1 saccharopine dehydrogenase [Parahaliea maris]